MKLMFAGTPGFAAAALQALLASRHAVTQVLTQPDRPAGRGMKLQQSAVKQLADKAGIPVQQPATLKDPTVQQSLREAVQDARAELLVVAAYGLILPQAVLDLYPRGAINIHASLLPRWRGAAPIQRALLAGDAETGICIMQMDAGLDTGPVLLSTGFPIEQDDDSQTLHNRLAVLGGKLIVHALDELDGGAGLVPRPQPAEGATYAKKIAKAEARIDWNESAAAIDRQVRAFRPAPGAVTTLAGAEIKLWRARPQAGGSAASPGTVLEARGETLRVACGSGSLQVLELQRAGGQKTTAAQFLRGHALPAGARFGVPV